MTDYPLGLDLGLVDGVNFDELEELLAEYTNNEIQTSSHHESDADDDKMGNVREEVTPKLVAGGVSAGFFVICLALTCRWRRGLILYVFGAKAAATLLYNVTQIIIQVLVHWQPIEDIAQETEVVVLQDWRLLKELLASLHCCTAGFNLIFFYELFQITCKIELRELRVEG